jgi:hypothetical protein
MRDKSHGVKFVLKTEKATEPSREALAAFGFCKAHASPGSRYRRHVRLGLRLFDRRGLFLNQRLEDSLVCFLFYCSSQRLIDSYLTAQSKSSHHFVVALYVRLLQIIEQLSSLLDHL